MQPLSTQAVIAQERRTTGEVMRLRSQLSDAQRAMLQVLEYFAWELRFVRWSAQGEPVPVISLDDRIYAVLRADGTVDDEPGLVVRH
ncbi:hypothetical protein ACFOLC_12025 [Lysobacter cavernae]|uniref:Uncharacterized protein n=1 Tax=Lysobacter cavernae TaxID=1685901 RepID=A0ABV7RQ33_9GAMM